MPSNDTGYSQGLSVSTLSIKSLSHLTLYMSSTTTASPTATTATCVTMTPGKNGYVPVEACNSNYGYNPSFPAAVVTTMLFGSLLALHVFKGIKYRKVSRNILGIVGHRN